MIQKLKEKQLLLCFLIPFGVLLIYQILLYLCGKLSFVANDCYYQYVSFYELFYQKVKEGSYFFFSDKGSLGVDFYGIYCYYLSSPLNLILFLFPKGCIPYLLNFLIALKLSLCGLSMGYYLKTKFKTTKYIVLYSCIWCFCGYFAGYLWNIMWLDVLIWFPVILIGMDDLVYEKKTLKYTSTLALAIFSNYFMGFIVCIFLFFRFFTMKFKSFKDLFFSGIRFGICSISSALLSAIIIIPSFFTLQETAIADEKLADIAFENFTSFYDILKGFMFGEISNAITKYDYKANIFISLFVILTFFIYLFAKNISIFDKLRNAFLIILIFISFNNKFLNFIWHGFHEQNGIPNRFAFIAVFLIIECSFICLQNLGNINLLEKTLGFISSFLFFYLIYRYDNKLEDSFILTLVFLGIYFLLLVWNKVISTFIFIEVISFFLASSLQVSVDGLAFYNHYYDDFEEIHEKYGDSYYREKMSAVDNLDDSELYSLKNSIFSFENENIGLNTFKEIMDLRSKWLSIGYNTTSNECTYFGLKNASMFNTFTHKGLQRFMFKTGNIGSENTIRLSRDNIFLDMMLGIKYDYIGMDERYNDNFSYEYKETIGNIKVYENKYALSLGYLINENISYDDYKDVNQFEAINKVCSSVTGVNKIFEPLELIISDNVDCKITKDTTYYYGFERTGSNVVIGHEYLVSEDRSDYMYLHANTLKKARVFINNELIIENKLSQNMIEIGALKEGDKVRIELYFNNSSVDYRYNLFLYTLDEDMFIEAYNRVKENQLEVLDYKDGYIKGSITKSGDRPLLITVPYTSLWNIFVNGKEIEPELFSDTFICVDLEEGENIIELKYSCDSFNIGIILTLIGLVLYTSYNVGRITLRNKKGILI